MAQRQLSGTTNSPVKVARVGETVDGNFGQIVRSRRPGGHEGGARLGTHAGAEVRVREIAMKVTFGGPDGTAQRPGSFELEAGYLFRKLRRPGSATLRSRRPAASDKAPYVSYRRGTRWRQRNRRLPGRYRARERGRDAPARPARGGAAHSGRRASARDLPSSSKKRVLNTDVTIGCNRMLRPRT